MLRERAGCVPLVPSAEARAAFGSPVITATDGSWLAEPGHAVSTAAIEKTDSVEPYSRHVTVSGPLQPRLLAERLSDGRRPF